MNETGISWASVTWNPMSGCTPCSEGCQQCYAEVIAENQRGSRAFPNGFGLTLRPHKLVEPKKLKTPSLIFTNSMSDLFWDQIPESYRDQIVDVIEECPQHEFQVLTKRHETLLAYSKRRKLPGNFWAGVSIENQRNIGRAATLAEVDAEVRFISLEPMLGPVVFDRAVLERMHWMIIGGESGLHMLKPDILERRGLVIRGPKGGPSWIPRPDRIDWIRSVVNQCQELGVKTFFKQFGGPKPDSGGRTLDGRTWDEFPRAPAGVEWVNPKLRDAGVSVAPRKLLPVVNVGQRKLF